MRDLIERAELAVRDNDPSPHIGLVAELLAEVKRLQSGGAWVEHVERQRAMKRERDGDCICDPNPETTNGPDEFCPWHGRSYNELLEMLTSKQAEINRLRSMWVGSFPDPDMGEEIISAHREDAP